MDMKTATIATLASLTATTLVALTAIGIVEEVNAARSGPQWEYCFNAAGGVFPTCFTNKGECQQAQRADPIATSDCYRRSIP